jgi:hypothetical protein
MICDIALLGGRCCGVDTSLNLLTPERSTPVLRVREKEPIDVWYRTAAEISGSWVASGASRPEELRGEDGAGGGSLSNTNLLRLTERQSMRSVSREEFNTPRECQFLGAGFEFEMLVEDSAQYLHQQITLFSRNYFYNLD